MIKPPHNVGAYTAPYGDYPNFISVNVVSPVAVVISLRSGDRRDEHNASITLASAEYAELLKSMVGAWAAYTRGETALAMKTKLKVAARDADPPAS